MFFYRDFLKRKAWNSTARLGTCKETSSLKLMKENRERKEKLENRWQARKEQAWWSMFGLLTFCAVRNRREIRSDVHFRTSTGVARVGDRCTDKSRHGRCQTLRQPRWDQKTWARKMVSGQDRLLKHLRLSGVTWLIHLFTFPPKYKPKVRDSFCLAHSYISSLRTRPCTQQVLRKYLFNQWKNLCRAGTLSNPWHFQENVIFKEKMLTNASWIFPNNNIKFSWWKVQRQNSSTHQLCTPHLGI